MTRRDEAERLPVTPAERAVLAAASAVLAVSRQHDPARESAYLAVCGDVLGCLADGDVPGAARCLGRMGAPAERTAPRVRLKKCGPCR